MLHVDATEAIHYDNTLLLFVNDGIIFGLRNILTRNKI